MPNYDVIEDYNSYHGIRTKFAGADIKSCKGCQHKETCIPFVNPPCEAKNATDEKLQQKSI